MYLFMYDIFNHSLTSSGYSVWDGKMITEYELDRILMEVVVA
jgi:hypothetical protein